MKKLSYVLIVMFGLMAASCTDAVIEPKDTGGEDDPIVIPPPPPKP